MTYPKLKKISTSALKTDAYVPTRSMAMRFAWEEGWFQLRRMWQWIMGGWLRSLKVFMQRGLRGYAIEDVWSLDDYLASWLPHALRDLYQHPSMAAGYPPSDNVKTQKQWHRILETMAQGFDAHHTLAETWPSEKERRALERTRAQGLQLFIEYFGDLWD